MADIFISYSSADEQVARNICTCLRNAGLTCWIACENKEFGESYAKTITENLLAAKVVLVCMSPASGASPHVERELDMAVNENKKILPILLTDFDLSTTCFKYYAGSTHYMHFAPTAQFRDLLVARALELIGQPPVPPIGKPKPKPRTGWGWIVAAALILVALVVVVVIALEPWAPVTNTFSFYELRITLPEESFIVSYDYADGNTLLSANSDGSIAVYAQRFSFDDGYDDWTVEDFYSICGEGHDDPRLYAQENPPYFTFQWTNDDEEVKRSTEFVYRTSNAYWLIEFGTGASEWDTYSSDIFQWAQDVRFVQ